MKALDWLKRQHTVRIRGITTVQSTGTTARFHVRSKPEYKVIVGGLAEAELRDPVFAQLRPTDVMIEIGGHIGSWSVFLAKHLLEGHLHVFEPVPHNFEKLVANLELNGLKNVTPYQKAMSETPGKAEFSLPDNDAPVEGTLLSHRATTRTFEVEVDALDVFAQTLDRPPTVLKIDCEGAEAMVLRGGMQTLSRWVRVIFLELHPGPLKELNEDPAELTQRLKDLGFEIVRSWHEGRHLLLVKPDSPAGE